MTVIAFDGKTVAADKRCSFPGKNVGVTKIFRVSVDEVLVIYGSGHSSTFAREWIAKGKPDIDFTPRGDDVKPSFAVIHRNGVVSRYEGSRFPLVTDAQSQYTEGSGRDYAAAAMLLGCDARKAVAVACELCQDCGNGIDVISFDDPFVAA